MDSLGQWRKGIEDALMVMDGLQARQSRALRDHAEWLEEHERAMRVHDRAMAQLDERIEKLLSAMGVNDRAH
jgi:L-lactate utilization protein LutB